MDDEIEADSADAPNKSLGNKFNKETATENGMQQQKSTEPAIADDAAAGISCTLQAFDEKDAQWVFGKIARIADDSHTEYSIEDCEEKFKAVLDRYQEQPHLLDRSLPQMFSLLTKYFIIPTNDTLLPGEAEKTLATDALLRKRAVLAAKYMSLIAKVRGYKTIIRHLPHEVHDLPRVLHLLQNPALVDRSWEVCYMLLLWLSIAAQVPFKLALLDAGSATTPQGGGAVQQMFDIAKRYLLRPQSDKPQDAAAFLLAKLLARPDTQSMYLEPTIDYLLAQIKSADKDGSNNTDASDDKSVITGGALLALAMIFKYCARDALVPHAPRILDGFLEAGLMSDPSGNDGETAVSNNNAGGAAGQNRMRVRKLYMKAIQRVGLSLLKTRSHAWKYRRNNTQLMGKPTAAANAKTVEQNSTAIIGDGAHVHAVSASNGGVFSASSSGSAAGDSSGIVIESIDDTTIDPNIEIVLGELLRGLRDRDTLVRWPAAKGIGRIADRLPSSSDTAEPSFCSDIIDSILDIFNTYDADGTWHGACLALAEMARRGCVMPQALDTILPSVERALLYDCPKGSYSVGQQVRDAACYVYWAFARAFSAQHLLSSCNSEIIPRLRASLLIVALFDREVNCRRAAAAAIQESVGRQGSALWPHGIELIQLVDFEGVGRLTNTYLRLTPQICALFSVSSSSMPQTQPMPSSSSMPQIFIQHLISYKAVHTERSLRDLASKSLSLLVPHCIQLDNNNENAVSGGGAEFCLNLLENLLDKCLDTSLTGATHGLLLCVGNLFFTTCQCLISNTITAATISEQKNGKKTAINKHFGQKFASSARWQKISSAAVDLILVRIPQSRILQGIGQEMLREAVLHYMSSLIKAQLLAPCEVLCPSSNTVAVQNSEENGEAKQQSQRRAKLMQTLWIAVRECIEARSERVQFLATKCLRDYCMLLLYDNEHLLASSSSNNNNGHLALGNGCQHHETTTNGCDDADLATLIKKKHANVMNDDENVKKRHIIRNSSSFDDILLAASASATSTTVIMPNTEMPKSIQIIVDYCLDSITGGDTAAFSQRSTLSSSKPASLFDGGSTTGSVSSLVPTLPPPSIPPSENKRRGGIVALTALPTPITLLQQKSSEKSDEISLAGGNILLTRAINIVIENTRHDVWYDCRWLECRAAACATVTELLLNAMSLFEEHSGDGDGDAAATAVLNYNIIHCNALFSELGYAVARVLDFLATNLDDYTRESSRGDIGRIVRERALDCLTRLLRRLAQAPLARRYLLMIEKKKGDKIDGDSGGGCATFGMSIQRIACTSVRLACEIIDRTRNKAVALLFTICGELFGGAESAAGKLSDDEEEEEESESDRDNDDDDDEAVTVRKKDDQNNKNFSNNKSNNAADFGFYANFLADFNLLSDAMHYLAEAETTAAVAETGADVVAADANKKLPASVIIAAGFNKSQIFHAMCRLLSSPTYAQYVVNGLALSVGSLTRSLVTCGMASLEAWLDDINKVAEEHHVLFDFMQCCERLAASAVQPTTVKTTAKRASAYEAMLPMPILRMFSTLLEYGFLRRVIIMSSSSSKKSDNNNNNAVAIRKSLLNIFDYLKRAAASSRAVNRVLIWISICSGCLLFDADDNNDKEDDAAAAVVAELRQRALLRLLIMLTHRYPRIRFAAAQQLQEALLLEPELLLKLVPNNTDEDGDEEKVKERILNLLDETDWNDAAADGRCLTTCLSARKELLTLFGLTLNASAE